MAETIKKLEQQQNRIWVPRKRWRQLVDVYFFIFGFWDRPYCGIGSKCSAQKEYKRAVF
jgi:hypothetical protein